MSKREKILVFIATLLLVAFGFISIINSLNDKIDVVSAENATLQSEKDEIDMKIGMITTLTETLATNTDALEELKEAIQDNITDEETVTLFTDMATANSLKVLSFNLSNGSSVFVDTGIDLGNIAMKTVTLSMQGNASNFTVLVDDLNERVDILVVGLSQVSNEDDNTGATDSFYMECVIFMEAE